MSLASRSQAHRLTPRILARSLSEPASGMPLLQRLKTRYRPYIVPLQTILAHIPQDTRLYDIGCGTGALLYLARQFCHASVAHGCEISPDAVSASRVFQERDSAIEVSLLTPEAIPPDTINQYQVVSVIDVIHHIPPGQQETFLTRLAERLGSGCTLILKDIERSMVLGAWCNQLHDLVVSREWVHHRSSQWVARHLKSAGLEIRHMSHHWTLWYPHFLIVAAKP